MLRDGIKLILYDKERIIIKNYLKLLDIDDKLIRVDDYLIIGEFLKISSLDEGILELYGKIKEIQIIV